MSIDRNPPLPDQILNTLPQSPSPTVARTKLKHRFTKEVVFLLLSIAVLGIFLIVQVASYVNLTRRIEQTPLPMTEKPLVKIAVNPWKASEVNAKIAEILLEEKMGYTVELVTIDEFKQWDAISKGEIHASLEVWPSGHKQNFTKYVDEDKSVENAGSLGPIGKIGWFMPSYLLKDNPTLSSWEGFKDPKNVALFASSSSKGQFLTGDASWTQYDKEIIANLGLNFEVQVLGSEDALIKAVEAAYKSKKPIVFYFWTPHWAHYIYDLVQVRLPNYTNECYANIPSGVNCDYPTDQLTKIFWSGFKEYAPDAYQFLVNFNYTNQDQTGMLAAIQINNKTVEEVARIWIKTNELTWRNWIR